MTPYFAYGANLNLKALPDRGVMITGYQIGVLPNWKLTFRVIDEEHPGEGFATIEPCAHSRVRGLVYRLDGASLSALDRYEDYPKDYFKTYLNIHIPQPSNPPLILPCLVYIGQPNRLRDHLLPSANYLHHFIQGMQFLADPTQKIFFT